MTDSVVGDGIDNKGVYLLYDLLCQVTDSVVGDGINSRNNGIAQLLSYECFLCS